MTYALEQPVHLVGDDAVYVVVDGGVPQDWLVLIPFQADEVVEVEYYSARDATFRWGTGFANGIVEVQTSR